MAQVEPLDHLCAPVELRERIGGISTKVLTETLRRLEYNGLVVRRTFREAPPRVTYELTALGEGLLGPIEMVGECAYQHGDEVLAAQDRSTVDGVTSAMI